MGTYGKDVKTKVYVMADNMAMSHKTSNSVINGLRARADELTKQVDALPITTEEKMSVIYHLREHQKRLHESLQGLVAAHDALYAVLGMKVPAEGQRPPP